MARPGALAAAVLVALAFLVGCEADAPAASRGGTATPADTRAASPASAPPSPVLKTVSATPTAIASLTPSGPAPAGPTIVATPVGATPAPVTLPKTPPLPAPGSASWPQFTDGRIGVAFRYPPECPPVHNRATLEVGPRIALDVLETQEPSLDRYVDELVRQRQWQVESRIRGVLGEQPTIRLEYRFGGTNRLGIAFLVGREGFVYAWQFTTGGGSTVCELPATFDAVLATFQLADIVR